MNQADQTEPGGRRTRRDFLVGGALLSTALLATRSSWGAGSQGSALGGSLARIVPHSVGPWKSSAANRLLIPTAEVTEETGYDDLLTRYFIDESGRTIMFLVAYGRAQSGGAQLHRPEACYPAAGFTLFDSRRLSVATPGGAEISGRALTAIRPGRIEQILYWSRVGTAFPTDSVSQSLATIRQTLGGTAPDGALVRMSMLGADRASALTLLRHFATMLLHQPKSSLRRLLTGRG